MHRACAADAASFCCRSEGISPRLSADIYVCQRPASPPHLPPPDPSIEPNICLIILNCAG